MRTTLDLDDILIEKARERARRTNQTLTRVIEESLRQTLSGTAPRGAAPVHTLSLTTVKGALLPGIDVSDRDALYERMEGRS